jgi:hypothetical protein
MTLIVLLRTENDNKQMKQFGYYDDFNKSCRILVSSSRTISVDC